MEAVTHYGINLYHKSVQLNMLEKYHACQMIFCVCGVPYAHPPEYQCVYIMTELQYL